MCGAALDEKPHRTLMVPWADIVLFLVIAGVVGIWWTRPAPTAGIAVAPTNTPVPPPTFTATLLPSPTLPPATPTTTSTALPTPTPTPIVYAVQSGDIPEQIARKYGVTVEALLALNNLTDQSIIHEGQKLVIPLQGPLGGPDAKGPTATPIPDGGIYSYQIKQGDTLLSIATQFSTTLDVILRSNNLKEDAIIQPGQVLTVPVGNPLPTAILVATVTRVAATVTSFVADQGWPGPLLLGPAEGAQYEGEVPILLRWASVGVLAEDEWYVVRVWSVSGDGGSSYSAWTKATSWRVPPEARPSDSAAAHLLRWQVVVVRSKGLLSDGRHDAEAVSPMSEVRTFSWN
jgi:LysM repeat protein